MSNIIPMYIRTLFVFMCLDLCESGRDFLGKRKQTFAHSFAFEKKRING
jgi:hypothetical protein